MKLKYKVLYLFFLAVLFCNVNIHSQENPNEDFPIGAFVYSENQGVFDAFDQTGMNHMVAVFNNHNKNHPAKLLGTRPTLDNYIHKYSSGYYSIWEAEVEVDAGVTGIKHSSEYGQVETLGSSICWASKPSTEYTVGFIKGPNYRQDKKHKWWGNDIVNYIAKFRMAFTGINSLPPGTFLGKISVIYTWGVKVSPTVIEYHSIELAQRDLFASDFTENLFKEDLFVNYNYSQAPFNTLDGKIPSEFFGNNEMLDDIPNTGIEFRIDYGGIGRMYVDYIEVYDDLIWEDYIDDPEEVITNIRSYCNEFPDWYNLKYWFAYEEPVSIDSYIPFRIVDSLIQADSLILNKKRLATIIYQHWRGWLNGDLHMEKFMELAKPERLMMDWYPISVIETNEHMFGFFKDMLQKAHNAQAGFWYIPQAF